MDDPTIHTLTTSERIYIYRYIKTLQNTRYTTQHFCALQYEHTRYKNVKLAASKRSTVQLLNHELTLRLVFLYSAYKLLTPNVQVL